MREQIHDKSCDLGGVAGGGGGVVIFCFQSEPKLVVLDLCMIRI